MIPEQITIDELASQDTDRLRIVVRNEALTWPEKARATSVTNSATYQAGCELLKGIKALRQKVADTFDSHVKRARDLHLALVAEKRDAEAPLTEAETILKRALVSYDTAQEAIRLQEEARLREQARQDEEARVLATAAALELEAARSGDAAMLEEARELIAQPVETPAILVERSIPKVAGISFRETWNARVVSLPKLIAFVAAHPEHANLLTCNQAALNSLARSMKGAMRVDGVEAVCTKGAAAGLGR